MVLEFIVGFAIGFVVCFMLATIWQNFFEGILHLYLGNLDSDLMGLNTAVEDTKKKYESLEKMVNKNGF